MGRHLNPFMRLGGALSGTLPNPKLSPSALNGLPPTVLRGTWTGGNAAATVLTNDIALVVPAASIIKKWVLKGIDGPGSCVVDIWKSAAGSYPPLVANSITAAALPTISAANDAENSTLIGWTTAIAAGDTLLLHLVSTSAFKAIILNIYLENAP